LEKKKQQLKTLSTNGVNKLEVLKNELIKIQEKIDAIIQIWIVAIATTFIKVLFQMLFKTRIPRIRLSASSSGFYFLNINHDSAKEEARLLELDGFIEKSTNKKSALPEQLKGTKNLDELHNDPHLLHPSNL
jgi:hypothetical protein